MNRDTISEDLLREDDQLRNTIAEHNLYLSTVFQNIEDEYRDVSSTEREEENEG